MEMIYKYTLEYGTTTFKWPVATVVRHVDYQVSEKAIVLWVQLVPTQSFEYSRAFTVVGTGEVIPEYITYVGTCQVGELVWHIYEVDA